MNRSARASALSLAVALAACSREVPEPAPAPPPTHPTVAPTGHAPGAVEPVRWGNSVPTTDALVGADPIDMSTSTGDTPPTVNVIGGSADDAKLSDLSKVVQLVTWPEMTVVSATVSVTKSPSAQQPSTLVVVPSSPLGDRWFAVKIGKLPPGIAFHTFSPLKLLPDGSRVSRFRPTSEGTVAWVELCSKGTKQRGSIVFSERVSPGSSPATLLTFDKTDCRYVAPAAAPAPEKAVAPTVASILFECDTIEDVTVTLGTGAASRAGVPISSRSFALARAALAPMGPSCVSLRL